MPCTLRFLSSPGRVVIVLALGGLLIAHSGCQSEKPLTAESSGLKAVDDDEQDGAENPPAPPQPSQEDTGDEEPSSPMAPITRQGDTPTTSEPGNDDLQDRFADLDQRMAQDTPSESLEVPDGTAEELLQFINELAQRDPRRETQQATLAEAGRIHDARLAAADKLIAMTDAARDVRLAAIQAKQESIVMLSMLGQEDPSTKLDAFAQSLEQDADPEIAQMGKLLSFRVLLAELQVEANADPAPVMERLATLLDELPPNEVVFQNLVAVVDVLREAGRRDEAIEALELIGNRFADNEDPLLATLGRQRLEEAFTVRLEPLILDVVRGQVDAEPALTDTITKMLTEAQPGHRELVASITTAIALERGNRSDLALEYFKLIQQAFEGHPDKDLAEEALTAIEMPLIRLGLVGNTVQVVGEQLDGSPFDWQALNGKVVLVAFWTTSRINDLANLFDVHDQFRERGLEVVGINLDSDRAPLERMLSIQRLPWPTIVSPEQFIDGGVNANARTFGVEAAAPFAVLIGADGKVVAANLRGPIVAREVEALLGTAAPASDDPATDSPPPIVEPPITPDAGAEQPAPAKQP